jgi:hypothetical protein
MVAVLYFLHVIRIYSVEFRQPTRRKAKIRGGPGQKNATETKPPVAMAKNQSTITTMSRLFTLLLILLSQSCLSYNVPQPPATPRSFTRRSVLAGLPAAALTFSLQQPASAALFEQKEDRRQFELCIVNILRLQYWAQNIAYVLETSDSIEERKRAYLDARLGGKAVVADKKVKIGGGASLKVFNLKRMQLKECLKDLKYYASVRRLNNKQMDRLNDDLLEALASLVEFDGLETTQDASPRSSLTLGMYNANKEVYVKRMLSERIVGLTNDIVNVFGPSVREQCEQYASELYASELPPKRIIEASPPTETIQETDVTTS